MYFEINLMYESCYKGSVCITIIIYVIFSKAWASYILCIMLYLSFLKLLKKLFPPVC